MKFTNPLWITSIATVIGLVTAGYSAGVYLKASQNSISEKIAYQTHEEFESRIEEFIDTVRKQEYRLKSEVTEISSELSDRVKRLERSNEELLSLAMQSNPEAPSSEDYLDLIVSRVLEALPEETQSSEIAGRLNAIENIIVQEPLEALEIPFLKRDISELNRAHSGLKALIDDFERDIGEIQVYEAELEALKSQIGNTNNWMIGIFGGLGVSVFGLFIGGILQNRNEEKGE